jgi:hypothetical protein
MIAINIGIGAVFFLMLAVMTAVAKWRGPGTGRTIFLSLVFLLACVSIVAWFALIALGLVE